MRCAEALQQLCQTKAKLTKLPMTPIKCTISGEGAKAAVFNTISEASLTTTKRNCKVECYLNSLSNGFIVKCNVDQTGTRNYSIQYTPTVRGRCEYSRKSKLKQSKLETFTIAEEALLWKSFIQQFQSLPTRRINLKLFQCRPVQ